MAEKVTNRLWKVEDDAGVERLVRGVDAHEIEMVKAQKDAEAKKSGKSDLIAEADAILESQAKEAKEKAKGTFVETTVEGVTTTPKTLLKSNEPDMPVDDALFRESQNNPDTSQPEDKKSKKK